MSTGLSKTISAVLTLICIVFSALCSAQLRLPKIIADHMVLQRGVPVPVWGWATPGERVTVKFAGQVKESFAGVDGSWKVMLDAMPASVQPAEMILTSGNTLQLADILVGEVWLCSGQSNMEYPMKNGFGGKPLRSADSLITGMKDVHPEIRLFKVEKVLSTPDVTTGGWKECSGEALSNASAIGYFFARDLQRELRVPVGVIMSSWGGSRIEAWTTEEMYAAWPAFKEATAVKPVKISDFIPGKNYRSMIRPLAPFAIKGFLWYQGEANCLINDGMFYADKMQALVEGWRKAWGNNGLPFYSVEIAPFYYSRRNTQLTETALPELREAQHESLKIPKTGLVVITDLVDNLTDIHPPYKWEVARRLSLLALSQDYGRKGIETSGPVFKNIKLKKGQATLSFSHADGLKSSDGKALSDFIIAGKDGKFEPANAVIAGNTIIVSSPGVSEPQNVRLAWTETAQPNLVNDHGFPAASFRTDAKKWAYKK